MQYSSVIYFSHSPTFHSEPSSRIEPWPSLPQQPPRMVLRALRLSLQSKSGLPAQVPVDGGHHQPAQYTCEGKECLCLSFFIVTFLMVYNVKIFNPPSRFSRLDIQCPALLCVLTLMCAFGCLFGGGVSFLLFLHLFFAGVPCTCVSMYLVRKSFT